jgi:geranylgeranyl reductase family protein
MTSETNADVLVIGCGPAGSAASCALARHGLKVVLADKHEFPRDKVCGDALIPDALNALQKLSLKDDVLHKASRLKTIRIYAPNGSYVALRGEFACIPRFDFDELLRRAAVESGTCFMAPYEAVAPLLMDDMVAGATLRNTLTDERVRIKARVTVLATGAAAEALLSFGVCLRPLPSAIAARVYVKTGPKFREAFDHLCISYDKAICPGYGWIFPGPADTFNVGVGVFRDTTAKLPPPNLRAVLETFLETFPPAQQVIANSKSVTRLQGAPLRTALQGAEFGRPGLLVVGEAAGLTFSFSGEGIGKAMESGLMAADLIASALSEPAQDVGRLAEVYANQLVSTYQDRFRAYEIAQKWLSSPAFANFLAWRGRSGQYVRRHLEGLLTESSDPLTLFSVIGLLKSLVH